MTRPAISLGLTAAPVVTIPARRARAFRVIDNRTSELTSWDTDLLPDALSGLNDLDIFSFDDVLPLAATAGKTDPDDIPETPKNPVTRLGDLWVLGTHRIACGDSTDQETVERLLDGAKPDLMVTDPPYGVNYDAEWRQRELPKGKRAIGKVSNDDRADWRDAYALAPGSVAYVWMGGYVSPVDGLMACGFQFRTMIVWVKNQLVISRGHYHGQHEPCWYAVRKGASAQWRGDRKQTTVWNIDKPRWGYPFNRSKLWGWITLGLARTLRGPLASFRRGSGPMRIASTTWSGSDGPPASPAQAAGTRGAGA